MTGKVKVQTVTRMGLAPLVELAEQLRSNLPGWEDAPISAPRASLSSDLALDLRHLAHHDADGFLTASLGDEVLGFAAAFVRSRQLLLSQPWLLPEHQDGEVAELLLRRSLGYGDRSGATDYAGLVLGGAAQHAWYLRFGFRPRFPVYRLVVSVETARTIGMELSKLLPANELSAQATQRRVGSADLERLDRLVRGMARPMDHEYWLTERGLRLAKVREGQRVAAYAYGGGNQCGPVVAATPQAALAALGWALQFAADGRTGDVQVLVPAVFEAGLEQLLEAGAACRAVGMWMSRQPAVGFERYVLPSAAIG
ncbi:MAG: hypothetical protein ACHQQS_13640 [Thermoanaerobaculales bacterium]